MDNLHVGEFELGVEGSRFWTQDTLRRVAEHDGMNIVANEYIAARADCDGVSGFAGVARELDQTLQINPYATDNAAAVLHQNFCMGEAERCARMAASRDTVQRRTNAHRWAGKIVSDLGRIAPRVRLEAGA